MKRLFTSLAGAALGCALATSAAFADETKVPLEQLPAGVRDTVTKEATGGKIEAVKKVSDDGKLFKADIEKAGEEFVLYLDDTGKILGRRKD
jgi:hypothetical protein